MILQWITQYKEAKNERFKTDIHALVVHYTLTKNEKIDAFLYTNQCQQEVVFVKKEKDTFTLTLMQVWTTEETSSYISYQKTHTKELCTEIIQKGHPLFRKVAKEYRELRRCENEQIEQRMMEKFLAKKERLVVLNEEIEQLSSEFRAKQEKWASCIEEIGLSTKKKFRLPQEARLNELKEEKRALQDEYHQLKRTMQRYQPMV